MNKMEDIDKIILNEIQEGIPLESRPFQKIGEKLGIKEEEIVRRINALKEKGYIRRFGGMFDSEKLGLVSTLVGMKVEKDLSFVAKVVSEYPGVTHNYERKDTYNIWFTLTGSSKEEIENILTEIKKKTGVEDMLNLPSIHKHKVKLYLHFEEMKDRG